MSRGLGVLLAIGFGLMTMLAVAGRRMAGIGGVVLLFGGAMVYQLMRRRSEYLATGLGLLWLALCVAGLVLFFWGWF